jgi:integrase
MASIRKLSTGKWIAEIRINSTEKGKASKSKTFATKLEAASWALDIEQRYGKHGHLAKSKTFLEALERYALEVSPHKKGARWEIIRLRKFGRDEIAHIALENFTTDVLQQWIERQRKTLSGASINRELNLISSILNTARREWKWIDINPATDVRKPRKAPPRDRLISNGELALLLEALGYEEDAPITTQRQQIAVALQLSIETAMRQGELWGLEWQDVYLYDCYVRLHDTKNGTKRDVPLSKRAIILLHKLNPQSTGKVIKCNQQSSGVIFRRACDLAGITDLHFHDARHTAITNLARKLQVLELARMVGHKDLRSLMIYYNQTASELAKRLD